jgi:V8-like Glu-specific endopeptidase
MVRFASLVLLLAAPALFATEVLPPLRSRTEAAAMVAPKPPLRTNGQVNGRASVMVKTTGASASDIAALRAANAKGDGPAELGIVREVQPVAVASVASAVASGAHFQWRGSVHVDGAARVRVRLDDVDLPEGARLWIYGASGEAVAFDGSLAHERRLWTPSVAGDTATIEVDAPGEAAFRIAGVADIRPYSEVVANGSECVTDLSCHTPGNGLDRAISFYTFVAGTGVYGCTGGLVNNSRSDGTPYFLTANHCVRNETSASSVEAYWDFRSSACNGPAPALESLPKSNGATLLATSGSTDVTLLRLNNLPPNRTFLGWDATALTEGTQLFHISHPLGVPQRYSTSTVISSGETCSSSPRPSFLYSTPSVGATDVGSSGAPVMRGDGYIVGQLKGACGPEPNNPCNRANREVDGAFSASYALLQPYLDPAPACAACTPNNTTVCLLNNRFKVTVTFQDPYMNISGDGKPIRYTENVAQTHPEYGPLIEYAFFSFFDFFPGSVETMIKMTKGVGINNQYWIWVVGSTSSSYTVTVQDTKTCAIWKRDIERDSTQVVREFEAFPLP